MQITNNVYLLDSSKRSHVYIIKEEEAVIVDTDLSFQEKGIIREGTLLGVGVMEKFLRKQTIFIDKDICI